MDLDRLATRLNPLVVRMLRSPLHAPLSRGLLLLSYTGRRSGRRHTLPLGYQKQGDSITVLASRAKRKTWWRNFREPAPVELVVRGRLRVGEARLVPAGSEAFREAIETTFRRLPSLAGQFGVRSRRGAPLTPEQLRSVAEDAALVKIALQPVAS